jgi:NitT/TauT family transport system substrate-binding protein
MISRRSASISLLGLLAACSPPGGKNGPGITTKTSVKTVFTVTPPPAGATLIRFATDWRAEAEHGGIYQALATGEYQKRGLDVKIIPGGPGVNVAQLLAAGAAEMGIGSNGFGVMNLAAERVPVKAVMASMQKDPQVLMAHPNAGIATLFDLKGHPILLSDSAKTSFWLWLKAKYGLNDAQVRTYTFNAAPFLSDTRAVQEGYVTSEPYTVEQEGHIKPVVMLLADSGYPGYAGMVMAPDKLIAANPKAVQAFVDATAAGWASYLDGDARPGDTLIMHDNPEMKPDVLAQARDKMRSYGIVKPADGSAIGAMTDARWKAFYDMAAGLGVYPKDLGYQAAYTLQFVGGK